MIMETLPLELVTKIGELNPLVWFKLCITYPFLGRYSLKAGVQNRVKSLFSKEECIIISRSSNYQKQFKLSFAERQSHYRMIRRRLPNGHLHGKCSILAKLKDNIYYNHIECEYLNNQLHGNFTKCKSNGNVEIECNYYQGLLHGEYYSQIDIEEENTIEPITNTCYYNNGLLHGKNITTILDNVTINLDYHDGVLVDGDIFSEKDIEITTMIKFILQYKLYYCLNKFTLGKLISLGFNIDDRFINPGISLLRYTCDNGLHILMRDVLSLGANAQEKYLYNGVSYNLLHIISHSYIINDKLKSIKILLEYGNFPYHEIPYHLSLLKEEEDDEEDEEDY